MVTEFLDRCDWNGGSSCATFALKGKGVGGDLQFSLSDSPQNILNMKKIIFSTSGQLSPLFLRAFLAIVLFPHGAQKMLGWFGGYGFTATMNYFTETEGLPRLVGLLVIMIEFVGPIALILGFATRIWSAAIFFLAAGIIVTSHSDYFFMNWFGNQPAEGMEYFLLMLGMSATLTVSGAGRYSLDHFLDRRQRSTQAEDCFALTNARV